MILNHTGRTVATSAYNRAHRHAIRHAPKNPQQPPHLDQTNRKPHKLTLTQALKITLLSYRHNLPQEALANLFEVSQPTISRTISTIEMALEKILIPLVRPLKESVKAPVLGHRRNTHSHLELAPMR